MNTNHDDACAAIRPLLFAAIDGEIQSHERLEVHAHLAYCEQCRSWERGERALTALLTDGLDAASQRNCVVARRWRPRLAAAGVAVLVTAFVLLVLPSATPRGSLVQRRLGPDVDWQVASERTLAANDVVDVPAAAAVTVQLEGVQLDCVGPARFSLEVRSGRWSVAVHDGAVLASVRAPGAIATGGETRPLAVGDWLLSAAGAVRQAAVPEEPVSQEPVTHEPVAQEPRAQEPRSQEPMRRDTESLLADGEARFACAVPAFLHGSPQAERDHLLAAERLLRAVLARTDVTPAQEQRAMFYLAASLSRQGRDEQAFALETKWLERFPDGSEASLVRYYMADYLRLNGRLDEAKALYERVLRDEGDSTLGAPSRFYLESLGAGPGAPPPPQHEVPKARLQARRAAMAPSKSADRAHYLVVPVDLAADRADDAGYLAAAHAASAFHGALEWAWDGEDFAALERQLRQRGPENVLFVLQPERLDLVLHRRLLLLSAAIDDDWFVDFAFGYLTAESGAGCERLWQRIVTVSGRCPLGGVWWQASVTSNATSLEYADGVSPLAKAAGFRGPHYYYSTANDDRAALIERSLATMRSASVVEFTGCGDPQGIWLFDDHRNLESALHWDYAANRVGADPGSMPRLLAARFRELALDAPVLWSGTCHSGAVCRVFVEADIVSTFGRTERTTVHRLEPEHSLALSWLAAGAASMLVPLGANHGMSVSMEVDFALRNGASLGETIKSTYDDVLLAAQGQLVLDLPVEGEPHQHHEAVMQGGGSNRILIGDPALRPFRCVDGAVGSASAETVTAERTEAGLRVTVERTAGWQPRAWDMYGQTRERDYRVLARVDLGALALQQRTDFDAGVTASEPGGAPLPYAMQRVAIEDHAGHRYLHLQANGTRAQLDGKAATIVFDVIAK